MSLRNYFRSQKRSSASMAKERLQIIVAHERAQRDGPDYLPMLQRDILAVVRKYVRVDEEAIRVQLDRQVDRDVLELNILVPEVEH